MRNPKNSDEWPRSGLEEKIDNAAIVLRKNVVTTTIVLALFLPWVYAYFRFVSSQPIPELVVETMVTLTVIGSLACLFTLIEIIVAIRRR